MRRKSNWKQWIAVGLMLTLVLQSPSGWIYGDVVEDLERFYEDAIETMDQMTFSGNGYRVFLKDTVLIPYQGDPLSYAIRDVFDGLSAVTYLEVDHLEGVFVDYQEKVDLKLSVTEAGLYEVVVDYYILNNNLLPTEIAITINGEQPFEELNNMTFESLWTADANPVLNRYGDEVAPIPYQIKKLQSKSLSDGSYRYTKPLQVPFESGDNHVSIQVKEGDLLITGIHLKAPVEDPLYVAQSVSGNETVVIQGQNMAYRNDSSIRATGEYNVDLYPYHAKERVLNVLDGNAFKRSGQSVTYSMDVPESGYYYLGFNYQQRDRVDFPVFMDIAVNGHVPFDVLRAYPFGYSTQYQEHLLKAEKDEDAPIALYLEAGYNELTLTLTIEPLVPVLESVEIIMAEINALSLEINKLTGTKSDKNRDFNLDNYIEGVGPSLLEWAQRLEVIYESLSTYTEKEGTIGAFASIEIAAKNLRNLSEKPNELPSRMTEFSKGTTSVIQYLANVIQTVDNNQLYIDRIYVLQDEQDLPGRVSFGKRIIEFIKRFFYSFGNQSYSVNQMNPDHLQVWVNRPRQYVEILQKMVDEDFTQKTGIHVDISIMPDQNKLILANSAGKAPDVGQSIHFALTHDLGIRGALEDLKTYPGYSDVINQYPPGLLVPAMIDDHVYAIPETMNFWVLFYRSDIFEALNIPVPDTMEAVTQIIPELSGRGMNFYYPSAGMPGIKFFAATVPLIYQYGGDIYGEVVDRANINSEASLEGLRALTDLFVIYNAPFDVPSFYQHFRDGSIPIGIAEYGMYNLLLNAAPEIKDSWDIALFPGVEDEKGTVRRYTAGAAEVSVIFESSSKKDEAWAYLEWLSSVETQVEFGYVLQTTYGKEFLWNTANIEAFNQLPWKSEHRDVIAEQSKWMMEPPRVPGAYMMEREISNLYNAVVIDGVQLRTAVDRAVKRIDRETIRKLEEFGYMENGVSIKPYYVPRVELEVE